MFLLTVRDLRHRATRVVVVICMGAVVFALLFVMTGLVEQFHLEPHDTVDAIGGDFWVVAAGISGPFTASSAIPADAAASVAADDSAPVVVSRSSLAFDGEVEEVVLLGHDADSLGAPPTVEGRAATAPGEAVVDRSVGVDVGDRVVLAGADFTVVGLTKRTTVLAGVPLVFVLTSDAQQLTFRDDSLISGVLTSGPEPQVGAGLTVMSSDAVAEDVLGPLENAIASVDLVRALLWLVAALIIGAIVYLSALERQRDFAVLKAVGAPTRTLMASLGLQAVLVAVTAVVIAIGLQALLVPLFPMAVVVPTRAFWQLPLFAVVMALVAGLAGMRRVATSDPVQAFAGAGA
jgi:putative ABC transport system permease protein